MAGQEGTNMALNKEGLIQELKHQIHSPLAAVRNALYLAGARTDNPETLRYLALAEAEVTRIAAVLRNADQIEENKQFHALIPFIGKALAA
jgi:two-component sensor histidine kinase